MLFQKGNKSWESRAKHGRDTLFTTPELMWTAACDYFQWCEDNPWLKSEAVKSGDLAGTIMEVPTSRPFTLEGLCMHLDCNSKYFNQFDLELHPEFTNIVTRIRDVIRNNKYEGALVGAYNANIIARELGFADTSNVNIGGQQDNPLSTRHEVIFTDMTTKANADNS